MKRTWTTVSKAQTWPDNATITATAVTLAPNNQDKLHENKDEVYSRTSVKYL